MATRFGGVTPGQAYHAKMRWVVGTLFAIVVLLVGVLAYLFVQKLSNDTGARTDDASLTVVEDSAVSTVKILVTSRRIEKGIQFEQDMLIDETRNPGHVPERAIPVEMRNSIVGSYAKHLINANTPVLEDYITDTPPLSEINIPSGMRAVSILVDSRRGVEGWARPGSRVDILWTFVDRDAQTKVATIVRYCQVLSVGGMVDRSERIAISDEKNARTTVTLLVSESDARKIELARTSGTLSLSLVGEEEDVHSGSSVEDIVDFESIISRPNYDQGEVDHPADGVMYTQDPKSGAVIRYELRGGRWKRAIDG